MYDLRDVLVGHESVHLSHVHLHLVRQEILRQASNFFRPGGREHHGPPFLGNMLHHGPNLRLEAHVQHPIGLVQHQKLHPGQVALFHLQNVVEPSGRGDDALDAPFQPSNLQSLGRSTVETGGAHSRGPSELLRLLSDLTGELAGGRQHQDRGRGGGRSAEVAAAATKASGAPSASGHASARSLRGHSAAVFLEEGVEGGQEEAGRLAASRLGDADEVTSSQHDGPRHALDASGGRVPGLLDGLHDGRSEGSVLKRQVGSGGREGGGMDDDVVGGHPRRRIGGVFGFVHRTGADATYPSVGQDGGVRLLTLVLPVRRIVDVVGIRAHAFLPSFVLGDIVDALQQIFHLTLFLRLLLLLFLSLQLLVTDPQHHRLGLQGLLFFFPAPLLARRFRTIGHGNGGFEG
mmetsp:Transcript_13399/g.29556  ORF Transcript_13399/g.29556 Transcript_13399/m.29556 type:complete len:404 (-) Transcript_13399:166-1377(-)